MGFEVEMNETGFDEIIAAWENFDVIADDKIKTGVNIAFGEIANAMRDNVTSMFTKGYATGVLFESVSHTAVLEQDGSGVLGSVGVYNMSNKTGSSKRRATAPMLAIFYEKGIRPHSTLPGSRLAEMPSQSKPRGAPAKGVQDVNVHPGHVVVPFLSNAFDMYAPSLTEKIFNPVDYEFKQL